MISPLNKEYFDINHVRLSFSKGGVFVMRF